jgi:hypothetical protein
MRRITLALAAAVLGVGLVAVPRLASATATAQQPQRVLDTREGTGAPRQRLAPGQVLTLSLPAASAAAASSVSLNLTVTDATAAGFLTVWPCGGPPPATSILNFVPGQTAANFAAVGLGSGSVCLAASAPVHVIGDLMGWFTGTNEFTGATPTRLLDTRIKGDRLVGGAERRLSLAAGAGIPGDAAAAALNVTVVSAAADGFVVAYPCGPRPLASTVNFRAGEIIPNFTIVPYTGKEICLFSSTTTDVVVDSFGWASNTGGLQLASPSRLLDTRSGFGAPSAATPAAPLMVRVAGRGGVPNDAAAALITITATGGTADGFVTAWPCDQPRPLASVLNLRPGLLRSNLALARLADGDGTACLYAFTNDGSPVHLVADAVGWIPGGPMRAPPPGEPQPPQPPTGGSGHFSTLPVGSALPGDAECAARVRKAPEVRSGNATYNATKGFGTPNNPPWPLYNRITGNFTGTTDEIIQWAACKWGIDEDIVRAQTAKESWWNQSTVGDNGESFGLQQVREPYAAWAFNNGVGDSKSSSAFNMDVAMATRRNCFEGNETWLNTVERGRDYAAGDLWGCVGMWFAGRWYTGPAVQYTSDVQAYLNQRIWETPDFLAAG